MIDHPSPIDFFGTLVWLDGKPLIDTIEDYRKRLFMEALYSFRHDGTPRYNLVLAGRGKKNAKTLDLILAALYCLLVRKSVFGNDAFVLANDLDQANDDLSLAKKLIAVNPRLGAELEIQSREIRRKDKRGSLRILPADVAGGHGKTAAFVGWDEIHGYRDWSLMEALQPDPHRPASLQWVTSYDTLLPTGPLVDLKRAGIKGDDPRMLFSWYSGGDLCTDPEFADLPPEERANPSMHSWPEGAKYLEQQKKWLPTHRYRRLHLNLPGAPDGCAFDADAILACVVRDRASLPPRAGIQYFGVVDMSGGSNDDSCFAVSHLDGDKVVLDLVMKQAGKPPFNPRDAVKRFALQAKAYGLGSVSGDAYGGETFRQDFADEGLSYRVVTGSASDTYEQFEPLVNAHQVELLDHSTLTEQLMTLVWKGAKIRHQSGDHDDHAAAACLAIMTARGRSGVVTDEQMRIAVEMNSRGGHTPYLGGFVWR